jgi:ankyrin repeat protein
MTSQQLPERPNLEQLKNQAKTLLRAAHAHDATALLRFRALPALADKTVREIGAAALALHDAQSVIAREHGFVSWNELREHVEAQSLSFASAVDEFVRCATGDAAGRAQRLLALHPGIAHASLQAELVLADERAVAARLRERADLATLPGGPQEWEPLLYVCHTCLHRQERERLDGLVAIARRLLELGANPNAVYVWRWHPELPRTALWGALCAVAHLPLAEALLEAGAQPTDGVSMHITAGSANIPALELLLRHGADVNGIPGGVPPLVYLLPWSTDPAGPRWLIEHGADANLAWTESGDAPLHVAAQRWDVPMVEMLVRHGGDVTARRRTDGSTPHTLAALSGNDAVATWLLEHGARDELSLLERFVAACARGDGAQAQTLLHSHPSLRGELTPAHHLMLHRPAESGRVDVLATMLACGFDPRAKDKDGVTALHRAAMAGRADAARVLLDFGAPIDALDRMFDATPLVWAVEGWRSAKHAGADHVAVARVLIAAGGPVDWTPPTSAPSPEGTLEMLADLVRAARNSARS